jgi:hypothetical protein
MHKLFSGKNLKENMLSIEILLFYSSVFQYKEFNLFERIINTLDLQKMEELKWLFLCSSAVAVVFLWILRKNIKWEFFFVQYASTNYKNGTSFHELCKYKFDVKFTAPA